MGSTPKYISPEDITAKKAAMLHRMIAELGISMRPCFKIGLSQCTHTQTIDWLDEVNSLVSFR
jgi:hypothetical protein